MTQDNKPINSHVEEYLDYYCNLSHAPGFAVLLKGQWGAGKTWFISQYQEKLKQEGKKCLYVSLYGMTSFSEIGDAFFQQLHPFLSSKRMIFAGKILKVSLKGLLKIDLNGDGKDDGSLTISNMDIPDYLKNADQSILIFDDLERCKIDLSNILGYINSFVEHQELKVIILANEEKVIELCSEYNTIKEKLIGKTFSISPDFKSAFNKFISRVEDEALKRFLSDNTELIKDLYTRSEYENLRNLGQTILDFERLFKVLPEKVKNKPELLQDLWYLLMVFSIEIKRGTILANDICKIEDAWKEDFRRNRAKDPQTEEASLLQKNISSFNRYRRQNELFSPFPNCKWWESFFDKGNIAIPELEQSLSSSKYFQDENNSDWIKLWHHTDLTDDEFENLLKKVEGKYDRREFLILGEIIHVTGLFLMFSDVGIYQKSKEEILKNSILCIDDFMSMNRSSSIYESVFSDIFLGRSYANLGFAGKDLEEFKEFYAHIAKAQEVAKKDYLQEAGQDLLEIMQSDTRKFSRMLSIVFSQEPYDHIYYRVPILQSIKPEDFIERLLTMKQEDQRSICETLSKRFESPPEEILEELTWLKSVQTLLIKEADSKKGKLSGYLLESLSKHYLENAIERVSAKSLEGKEL